jgi:beta-phosphoglucomutase-like phosphatase (HAD superfamily)
MFFDAAKEFLIRLDQCLYIGDDERDCAAAANAGCGMVYLTSHQSRPQLTEVPTPYFQTPSLLDSIDMIVEQYQAWDYER